MGPEYTIFTLLSDKSNDRRDIVIKGTLHPEEPVVVNLGDERSPHLVELTYLGKSQTHMRSLVNGTYLTIDSITGFVTGTRRHLEVIYPEPPTES